MRRYCCRTTPRCPKASRHALASEEGRWNQCAKRSSERQDGRRILETEISAPVPSILDNTGSPDQVLATLSAMRERAQREAYREQLQPLLTQSQPLPSARWANIERPQFMAVLGVPLAAQRLEARSSRGRGEIRNHQASILGPTRMAARARTGGAASARCLCTAVRPPAPARSPAWIT